MHCYMARRKLKKKTGQPRSCGWIIRGNLKLSGLVKFSVINSTAGIGCVRVSVRGNRSSSQIGLFRGRCAVISRKGEIIFR